MTSDELIRQFNNNYGMHNGWPKTYEVDHETYANCCQAVFKRNVNRRWIQVAIGKSNGLMFRDVELILEKRS